MIDINEFNSYLNYGIFPVLYLAWKIHYCVKENFHLHDKRISTIETTHKIKGCYDSNERGE